MATKMSGRVFKL